MTQQIFITGTDTDVGKTYVTVGLLRWLNQHGIKALGIKPISAGSDDADQLRAASYFQADYRLHNPIYFDDPIAPHIAAKAQGERLSVQRVHEALKESLSLPGDVHLIEGVGGWSVPLNEQETMGDFVKHMGWPVILVVGMRLGCLNHSLLTVQAIRAAGLNLIGWVANFMDEGMARPEENLASLVEHLQMEPLAVVKIGSRIIVKQLFASQFPG